MSSHVIDVAIGMAYVYLIFSLICTVVNEMFAGVLTLRAKTLELGIKSLFSEDLKGADAAGSFTNRVYSHALVRGLYQGVERKDIKRGIMGRIKLPSYIPAATFATALIDSVAPDAAGAPNAFAQVQTAIQALPDSTTKKALLSLTLTAGGKLEDFQKNVEGWFNDSMDRASGWYKRQTKKMLLVIAFAVTIAANADSVRIVKTLWIDPAVREATVKMAQDYASAHKTQTPAPTPSPTASPTPSPTPSADKSKTKNHATHSPSAPTQSPTPSPSAGASDTKDAAAQSSTSPSPTPTPTPSASYSDLEKNLPQSLPIGWPAGSFRKLIQSPIYSLDDFQIFLGWTFTALALSLGAPFWFDVLNKFMVVRSTVKPKEKAGKATKG
jgi:hypothetical protein